MIWYAMPQRQEILIRPMDGSDTKKADERVAALEKKTGEMEALLKGLMAEMLDVKAIAANLARQSTEQYRPEPAQETVSPAPESAVSPAPAAPAPENRTVIRVKSAPKPEAAPAPAEPEMVRIMQPDGTMKLEVRRGDKGLHR
jgi:Predicted membrane protein